MSFWDDISDKWNAPWNPVANFSTNLVKQATGLSGGQQLQIGTAAATANSLNSMEINPYITMAGIGYAGATATNQANKDIAQAQMDFQREQTGTAYQRATKDMLAAGLNPALAYQQGGADSGSGAGIPAVDALGAALEKGIAGFNAISESDLRDAQSANLNQQTLNLMDQKEGIKYKNQIDRWEATKANLKGRMYQDFLKNYETQKKNNKKFMEKLGSFGLSLPNFFGMGELK